MPADRLFASLLLGAMLAASALAAGEEDSPEPELLEFLAEFLTEEGQWIDPLELESGDLPRDTEEEESQ
ncbi:MAG: hypothetical protein Kow006_30990 [Gammaproteobacteria bacterium]